MAVVKRVFAEAFGTEEDTDTSLKEAYEKWTRLNEEIEKVEAQIQRAHAAEYEKLKKEYTTALQKVRSRYNKWLTHGNEYEKMRKKRKSTPQKVGHCEQWTNKIVTIKVDKNNRESIVITATEVNKSDSEANEKKAQDTRSLAFHEATSSSYVKLSKAKETNTYG